MLGVRSFQDSLTLAIKDRSLTMEALAVFSSIPDISKARRLTIERDTAKCST